jgi:hypothetical protein
MQPYIGQITGLNCCDGQPPSFTIFLGDANTIGFRVVGGSGCASDPIDLTDCTEIVVNIPNADGTFLQLKLSLSQVVITSPPVLGKFTVAITSDQSALFNTGEFQNIDVTLTISGQVFTVPFIQALSVFEVS